MSLDGPVLQLVDYSPLSVVIYTGKNKEYDNKLKEFGGKRNPNLAKVENDFDDIGFVFGKKAYEKNQEEIDDFLTAVNEGTYEPEEVPRKPTRSPARLPASKTINKASLFTGEAPAMSSDDINRRLAVKKSLPTVKPLSMNKSVAVKKVEPATETVLQFPNNFVGADNNQYQIMVHTVLIPKLAQECTVNDIDYTVSEIKDNYIILTKEEESLYCYLINGKWTHLHHSEERKVPIFQLVHFS